MEPEQNCNKRKSTTSANIPNLIYQNWKILLHIIKSNLHMDDKK
jgi:hypothetical protein